MRKSRMLRVVAWLLSLSMCLSLAAFAVEADGAGLEEEYQESLDVEVDAPEMEEELPQEELDQESDQSEEGQAVLEELPEGIDAEYDLVWKADQEQDLLYQLFRVAGRQPGELTFAPEPPEDSQPDWKPIIEIDETTGCFTMLGCGEAVVRVTEQREDQQVYYLITIHIKKADQTISGWKTAYTAVFGQPMSPWGSLTASGGGKLTFSSGDPSVATVNAETGEIQLKSAGSTVITVTAAETELYQKAQFQTVLTVEKGTPVFSGRTTSYTVSYSGRSYNWSNIKVTGGGKLTFSSSDPSVATVNAETGVITQKSAGTVVITVKSEETDQYRAGEFRSTIVINKGQQSFPNLKSYYLVSCNKSSVYSIAAPNRRKGNGKLTYSSSNPKVISVDQTTGLLRQGGACGTAVITIQMGETAQYAPRTVRFTIQVKRGQKLSGIRENYSVTYLPGKTYNWGRILQGAKSPVTYTSSAPDVIAVDSSTGILKVMGTGTAEITIQAKENSTYCPAVLKSTIVVKKLRPNLTSSRNTIELSLIDQLDLKSLISYNGDGVLKYRSSNSALVSVTSQGVLKANAPGQAQITIEAAETKNSYGAKLTLTVNAVKCAAQLTGWRTVYDVTYANGKSYQMGTRLRNSGDGALTFSSSRPDVVSIDPKTGAVVIHKPGTVVLTAVSAETKSWYSGTVSTTMNVISYQRPASYLFTEPYRNGPYYERLMSLYLTGDQRQDILTVALSQVGYSEGNSSAGTSGTTGGMRNFTEYGSWYYNYVDSSDVFYAGAWCSMFVSWCANEAGISKTVIPPKALVAYMKQTMESKGLYYTWSESSCGGGGQIIRPGDMIFYSATRTGRYNHIGLVTGVTIRGGTVTITTVEGNAEDCCREKSWTLSMYSGGKIDSEHYIRGFACPKYAS